MRRTIALSALGFACWLLSSHAEAANNPGSFVVKLPPNTTIASSNPQDAARQLLVQHAALPPHVALAPERTFSLRGATVYRFRQTHLGVPVYARGAGIAVDDHGNVILATSRTERDLPASVTPLITAEVAAEIASQFAEALATGPDARLVIVPMPTGSRLAWMVQAPPLLPELYAPLVTIDALTGRVLGSINAVRFKNNAKVFKINPVEDQGVTTTVTLPIPGNTPQNEDIVSYNCVDQGTVKIITTQYGSRKVHLCDLLQAPADPGTGDFTQYDPAADNEPGDYFGELQIFYHSTQAYEYFRSFDNNASFKLGGSDYPLYAIANWMTPPKSQKIDGGVEGGTEGGVEAGPDADPDGDLESGTEPAIEAGPEASLDGGDGGLAPLKPYQNAAYVPYSPGVGGTQNLSVLYPDQIKGGVLQFGQGVSADYSYDGMVIYHEFTHAVVASTLDLVPYWHLDSQGATVSPGALNEALADFFAGSITNKAKMGTYAIKDMQGPGIPVTDCIRDLDNANTCPKDMVGEVHTDSVFFTGALWKVRDQLATDAEKKKFTQAMFVVMTTITSGDLGFEDLASAFVTALGTTMDQATATAMQDEFNARGILPECTRILNYKGQPIRGTDPMLANTMIMGGMMEFNAQLQYAPAFFQVKVPIAAGTTELVATFKALSSGYGGSSFSPSFLVNYTTPITFDPDNAYASNTTDMFKATTPSTGDAGSSATTKPYTAHIPIPAGTTTAYVMLVNAGNGGAYFIDLAFNADVADAGEDASEDTSVVDTGAAGSPGLDAAAAGSAGAAPAADPGEVGGGCGCAVPRSTSGTGLAALLLAAAAWLARRKRS